MSESDPKLSPERHDSLEAVKYPKRDFFDLQHAFGQRIAQKLGIPLEQALFTYTNLFRSFGGRRGEPESHPVWQAYLAGLAEHADDPAAYSTALHDANVKERPVGRHFGSFSFNPPDKDGAIRIHFRNAEPYGVSPLDPDRLATRRDELTEMFTAIKKEHPEATTVRGGSWLYNLDEYKSLFPASYTRDLAEPQKKSFQGFDWWGQFLDRDFNVRSDLVQKLFERLEKADNDKIADAFPYKPYRVSGPIQDFYDLYLRSPERQKLAELEKTGLYYFHGTNMDIDMLHPRQAMDTERGPDGDPAVFVSPAADFAIFMAVARHLGHTSSGATFDDRGTYTLKFSATQDVLDALKNGAQGWVYVFEKKGFVQHNDSPVEFKSHEPVTPIMKIRVTERDLPAIGLLQPRGS